MTIDTKYWSRFADITDISTIVDFDNAAFAPHTWITKNEVEMLLSAWKIILLFKDNILIGEAQLLFDLSLVKEKLHINLEEDSIFLYGTAVCPEEQGKWIATILYDLEDSCANFYWKTKKVSTARPTNYTSLKARLNHNAVITWIYTSPLSSIHNNESERIRLILDHTVWVGTQYDIPEIETIPDYSNICKNVRSVKIAIHFWDKPDPEANQKIAEVLKDWYIGIYVTKKDIQWYIIFQNPKLD